VDENQIRLILWLVFIAVWVVSGLVKKQRDARSVERGDSPGESELREYFGEDEPEEEPHVSREDEFRKFLRTITGEPEPVKTEKPAAVRPAPQPVVSHVKPPEEIVMPREEAAVKKALQTTPAGGHAWQWGRGKLKDAVVFSAIIGPPRAVSPYSFKRMDRLRS
jgi:hypothetical protein